LHSRPQKGGKHGRAVTWSNRGRHGSRGIIGDDTINTRRAAAIQGRGREVDKLDNKRRFNEVHQFSVSRSVPPVTNMLVKNIAYAIPVCSQEYIALYTINYNYRQLRSDS
jgi:hypothetical protein